MEFSINHISAAVAILSFVLFIGFRVWNKNTINLSEVINVIIAGGMLPIAVGFVLYPFFPSILGSIEEKYFQITLIGLILLFIYIKSILDKLNKP